MEVQSVEEARFVDAQYFYYKKVKFKTPIFVFPIELKYLGLRAFLCRFYSLVMYAFIILFYAQG